MKSLLCKSSLQRQLTYYFTPRERLQLEPANSREGNIEKWLCAVWDSDRVDGSPARSSASLL